MCKRILVMALACFAAAGISACGSGSEKSGTISTEQLLSVYDFNVDDYVTLGDYSHIEVACDESAYEVDDEKFANYVNTYIEQNAKDGVYKTLDKQTVENGDVVNIDYTGTIKGKKFDGGSQDGAHLEIGSGTFIDGFEEKLIGHKVGDTFSIKLKFPDDYWSEDYAGKNVKFKVTIHSIEEKIAFDEMSDEDIAANFEYKTKSEMESSLKESLNNTYQQQKQSEIQKGVIEQLVSVSKAEVPDSLLQAELDDTVNTARDYAENEMGMEFADYLDQYEKVSTEQEYRDKITDEVKKNLEEQLIIDAVIKKEDWTITQAGYDEFLEYCLQSYGMEEEAFYNRYGGKEKLMLVYAENMLISDIMEKAELVAPSDKPEVIPDDSSKKSAEDVSLEKASE